MQFPAALQRPWPPDDGDNRFCWLRPSATAVPELVFCSGVQKCTVSVNVYSCTVYRAGCAVAGLVGQGEGVAVFHGQILQWFREAS